MAINLPSGFTITAQEPVDSRLILSKADMLNYPSARMPDHYFCVCSGDNQIYIYDESTAMSAVTGKFHPLSDYMTAGNVIARGYFYNNKFYEEAAHTTEITAVESKLYVDLTTSTAYAAYIYMSSDSSYHQISGGGSSSGDKTFNYEQSSASNTWVITHNLNKYPSVTVIDYGNNTLEGDIQYNSLNQLTIKFYSNGGLQSVSGYAYLN